MRRAEAVLFTGSPPLMLHFIAPLNLISEPSSSTGSRTLSGVSHRRARAGGFLLDVLLRFTKFWRRRVDTFEVLGMDQARRLAGHRHRRGADPPEPQSRRRSHSRRDSLPLPLPHELRGRIRGHPLLWQLGRCPRRRHIYRGVFRVLPSIETRP